MEKQLFLGIDGGQTSTLAVLCDECGRLLGVGRAGPSNHIHEPGGMARMENALRMSTQAAFGEAGWQGDPQDLPELDAVCCGMTGGIEVVADLFPRVARTQKLVVVYDLVTAHAGALAGAPGVIVIAGTGSVAFGVNSDGVSARAGGWAYIMGDEGSAYDLGRRALMAAARADDGRGPATDLLSTLLSHYQKTSLWDIRTMVYSGEIDRSAIAQLSRLVVQVAQQGDVVAKKIVNEGAIELSEIVRAVITRLGMDREESCVATVGGLFQAGPLVLDPFSNELHKHLPQAKIVPALYQPVIGALFLALKAGGIPVDKTMQNQLGMINQKLGSKEGATG
jgi:N-acetylglucosamine kinase-like BadF-type ATPase